MKPVAKPSNPNVNLPNSLTVLRLVLVPVFIWLMCVEGVFWRWLALVVFVVASITDNLDGHLARSRNLVTEFGMLADPIADKALTLGAFIVLSEEGLLPWWFTIVVAVRELGITLLREIMRRRGRIISAGKGGKVKTGLQVTLIIWLLIPWFQMLPQSGETTVTVLSWSLIVIAFIQTLVSAVPYLRNVYKWYKTQG